MNDNLLEDLQKQHSRNKPSTEDELQLLEDRPARIHLDSDEEGGEPEKAAPGIRRKTVTEVNTTAVAGPCEAKSVVSFFAPEAGETAESSDGEECHSRGGD